MNLGYISVLYSNIKYIVLARSTILKPASTFNWGNHPLVIPNLIKDSSVI